MDLSKKIGERFVADLDAIIKKEIDDPDFMPQSEYSNCAQRAGAMIDAATDGAKKMMTIAIAKHRIDGHSEDRQREIDEASEGLDQEDISVAVMGWWNP